MNLLRFIRAKKPCSVCGEDFYPGHSHEHQPKWSRRGFLFMAAAAPVIASVALPENLAGVRSPFSNFVCPPLSLAELKNARMQLLRQMIPERCIWLGEENAFITDGGVGQLSELRIMGLPVKISKALKPGDFVLVGGHRTIPETVLLETTRP